MFKKYQKSQLQEMRPYIEGEDMEGISITEGIEPEVGGMIAMDPENPDDKWYIAPEFFAENYVEADDTEEKSLGNTDINGTRQNVSDVVVFGDGDMFKLLCKASSKKQGWMKSTKAMTTPGGVVVQCSTQQRNPDGSYAVAEALCYVPGAHIQDSEFDDHDKCIGRRLR